MASVYLKFGYLSSLLLLLVSCTKGVADVAANDPCAIFKNSSVGVIAVGITGTSATVDWSNDLSALSDSLTVVISGAGIGTAATKPATFSGLADGTYTATVTYGNQSCGQVLSARTFIIDSTVNCTSWDSQTLATSITPTPSVGAVSVDWTVGTVTGQSSFQVSLTGPTNPSPVVNTKPAGFTSLASGSYTATLQYSKAACSDKTQTSGAFTVPVSFSGSVLPALSSCTGCHGASGGFTVNHSDLTAENSAICGPTEVRVIAGNATASAFYKKITGATCGSQMGTGGFGTLSAAQIQTIADWINQGALNN